MTTEEIIELLLEKADTGPQRDAPLLLAAISKLKELSGNVTLH